MLSYREERAEVGCRVAWVKALMTLLVFKLSKA